MKKTHGAITGKGSPLKKYQDVVVGSPSLWRLVYFEWCQMLAPLPGAFGMLLRRVFWPRMFAACGKGTTFGCNVVLRHPWRIRLGERVVVSEQCIIDGRSEDKPWTITLGDDVILSNQVILSCKDGSIAIGAQTGINAQTIIQSTNDCPVTIGRDVIIGQRCFVVGGGSYNIGRLDLPIREQGIRRDGGVVIGDDVWLGGNVTVLGGVRIGDGSVAAAGAVVTRSIASREVCMGMPAKVVRTRGQGEPETGGEA